MTFGEVQLLAVGRGQDRGDADGIPLEQQVQAAFEQLRFEPLETIRGRSDLRFERGGNRFVVEVKGTNKSAAEKHAAQLEKGVAEEAAKESSSKGILVVNGWRSRPIAERDRVFPHQMIAYSQAQNHCLTTGLQLLNMARAVQEGRVSADDVAEQVLTTAGCLEGWDNWKDSFVRSQQQAESQ